MPWSWCLFAAIEAPTETVHFHTINSYKSCTWMSIKLLLLPFIFTFLSVVYFTIVSFTFINFSLGALCFGVTVNMLIFLISLCMLLFGSRKVERKVLGPLKINLWMIVSHCVGTWSQIIFIAMIFSASNFCLCYLCSSWLRFSMGVKLKRLVIVYSLISVDLIPKCLEKTDKQKPWINIENYFRWSQH